jgi:glycosyltransferase involved in cell wall biosynthesis
MTAKLSDKALRIGLISADFAPNVGGVAAHVVELGRALVTAGHQVDVITLPLGDMRNDQADFHGMRVHRPRIPKARPFYTWLLRRWLRKSGLLSQLDILHVHGMRPIEASRELGLPVIFTNHTSGFLKRLEADKPDLPALARRLAHLDHILAPSDELADASRATGYAGPVDFIAHGVDVDRFHPAGGSDAGAVRDGWKLPEDHAIALLARRLVDKNGVRYFAEAAALLAAAPISFVFAGDGPERAAMTSVLDAANLLPRCRFLGNVPNSAMPDIYRAVDMSVLPSLKEATSITGLESMATALPLIGTRVGGIPAIIADGETGILVPPRDPAALAEAMARLAGDDALRQRLGQAGRARVKVEFSWPVIAEKTIAVYRRYATRAM